MKRLNPPGMLWAGRGQTGVDPHPPHPWVEGIPVQPPPPTLGWQIKKPDGDRRIVEQRLKRLGQVDYKWKVGSKKYKKASGISQGALVWRTASRPPPQYPPRPTLGIYTNVLKIPPIKVVQDA